jgi:hypothetical protein
VSSANASLANARPQPAIPPRSPGSATTPTPDHRAYLASRAATDADSFAALLSRSQVQLDSDLKASAIGDPSAPASRTDGVRPSRCRWRGDVEDAERLGARAWRRSCASGGRPPSRLRLLAEGQVRVGVSTCGSGSGSGHSKVDPYGPVALRDPSRRAHRALEESASTNGGRLEIGGVIGVARRRASVAAAGARFSGRIGPGRRPDVEASAWRLARSSVKTTRPAWPRSQTVSFAVSVKRGSWPIGDEVRFLRPKRGAPA